MRGLHELFSDPEFRVIKRTLFVSSAVFFVIYGLIAWMIITR